MNQFTPWQQKHSEVVHDNHYGLTVREDTVVTHTGEEISYTVVDKNPYVIVVPCNENGEVLLIEEYRYAVQSSTHNVLGTITGRHDGDPKKIIETALSELLQEGGANAIEIEKVAEGFSSPGNMNETAHIYFAIIGQLTEQALEPTEQIVRRLVAGKEAIRLAETGKITELVSLAAILMCRERILHLCSQ